MSCPFRLVRGKHEKQKETSYPLRIAGQKAELRITIKRLPHIAPAANSCNRVQYLYPRAVIRNQALRCFSLEIRQADKLDVCDGKSDIDHRV